MYPASGLARAAYWKRQIEFATKKVKPYFEASDILIKQYENFATTQREKNRENSSPGDQHASRTKANMVFGWIEQSIANLLDRSPSFVVSPRSPDSADGAPVVGMVANYWYNETGQLRQDERILLDAFLCPYGVKKIGWTTDVESRVHEIVDEPMFDLGDDIEADLNMLLEGIPTLVAREQDHSLHIEAKVRALQNPTLPEEVQTLIQDNIDLHQRMLDRPQPDRDTEIKFEAPYGQRWSPDDFLVDPLAQDGLVDARWIAFRWRKPIADVLGDKRYKNLAGLEPSSRPEDAPPEDPNLEYDDFGLIVGWEIWARDFPITTKKRRNVLITVVEGHDLPILEEEEWPYDHIEDYPCEILSFQHTVKNWYCKPTLVMAGSDNIQVLANEILDSFLYVIRKQKNILLYDPDKIEQDTMDAIGMAPDMSAFAVRGLQDGQKVVQPIMFGNVSTEKNQLLSQIIQLFDRAAGTPQPMRQDDPNTATEASIIDRRTTARESRRGSMLGEFQLRTARKFWQLTAQFKPKRLFLIHKQAPEWANIDSKLAEGEYNFRIDIGSQSNNEALERKQWMDLLNLFSGLTGVFQQIYQQPPNLAAVAERLLKRGYNDQRPEEILPMLNSGQGAQAAPIEQQAATNQMLQGTPAQPASEGPSVSGPPTEVESEDRAGAALPRLFREPTPSGSKVMGAAQQGA